MSGLKVIVKKGEKVAIGKDVQVRICKTGNSSGCNQFSLVIEAPKEMEIARERHEERFKKVINGN